MSDNLPAHTCPDIDRVKTIIRRHVLGEDRKIALDLMEELRAANLRLREGYASAREELKRSIKP